MRAWLSEADPRSLQGESVAKRQSVHGLRRMAKRCRRSWTGNGTQVRLKKLCILIPLVMLPLGSWLGYRTFHDRPFADIAESVAAIRLLS